MRWKENYADVNAGWLRWATLDGLLLPIPQKEVEAAQQRAAELEAQLTRYRESFSELPE
ncbi:MAG: hypothetical protein KME19_02965 [Microcoleus vaginatus WJT46-NPBG5]|nr:hypothetical protein [Microcoleus vaginatus WJT46-NPBG5]